MNADADTDAQADIEVEAVDVDEIVRQERVRAIFDARRECRQARTKAKEVERYESPQEASAIYRDRLEAYAREVESLCSQTDKGRRLWNDAEFGTIDITPRVEEMPGDTDAKRLRDGTQVQKAPDGREVEIRGLKALFELSPPFTARFTVKQRGEAMGFKPKSKQLRVDREIPIAVLDKMFGALNGYLAEIGFDVQVGQAQQHTKLDDDLLSEVEQWRRENL